MKESTLQIDKCSVIDMLKSSYNPSQKCLRFYEVQRKIHFSRACLKSLISTGKSNGVKIRIWSKSLGTRLLRTTGFIQNP